MERTIAYSMMALKMLKMHVTMYLKNTCLEKSNTKIHFNQTMFLLACIVNSPFKWVMNSVNRVNSYQGCSLELLYTDCTVYDSNGDY